MVEQNLINPELSPREVGDQSSSNSRDTRPIESWE